MRKNKILILALLVCLSIPVRAQNTDNNIIGIVVDKSGNPVYGASVNVEGGAVETRVETDKDGKFEIAVEKGQRLSVVSVDKGSTTVVAKTDGPMTIVMGYAAQTIDVGANRTFSRHESTAAVSTTYNEEFNKRSSRNISNSLYGYGLGLTTLQNAASTGLMADPTFYVRGLQSLSSSTPLVLVDGLERDMSLVSPEEVESVSILKDAAAVALYGYKGVNGAILITTKRGKYKTKEITFTYDHIINTQSRRPEFVDAATYASAVNEARGYEGLGARYTLEEVDAFRNGVGSGGASRMYPYLYPNVNWIDETFKDRGVSNKYTIEFRGGGAKFRYYTMANLLTDKGFIKTPNANDGYSTQNMYSRANLRTNLDIDLTATTKLKLNLLGTLSESRIPGASVNLWDMIYSIPSAAFPVRTEDDSWGGSTTWAGTSNPVAQSQGAAYSKGHSRSLFADLTLSQDLSGLLKGLGANFRLAYDNYSNILEDHSKTYTYAGYATSWTTNGPFYTAISGGESSEMGSGAGIDNWARQFNFAGSVDYNRSFRKWDVYSQFKWDYEYRDSYGLNTTIYRQNVSWYNHVGFSNRYYLDLALVGSASSLLAPGHKWAFFPSGAIAWRISEEPFLKDVEWISNLKLRASYGMTGNYSIAAYATAGTLHGKYANFNGGELHRPGLEPETRPTPDLEWERNKMLDIGLDFGFLKGRIHGTIDYYDSKSYDLLYLKVLPYTSGFNRAWTNIGDTRNRGWEVSLSTVPVETKDFHLGVNLSYYRNKEELIRLQDPKMKEDINNGLFVGYPVNGVHYNYKQVGIWQENEADLAAIYGQKPGEVKVADLDGNGKIDGNDRTILGTTRPDWVGGLQINAEWKNIDFSVDVYGEFGSLAHDGRSTSEWANQLGRWNTYKIDYWTPEKPSDRHPRPVEGQSIKYLDATGYYKNSYVNIRNITLGYTLPRAWMGRVVKKTRFYVTMNTPWRYSQFQNTGGISWWESFYIFGANVQF